jgi:2-succinyl-5-enolpyruvyl-6-hydroxy-3-cyclohexene-1-carboxylate synthase
MDNPTPPDIPDPATAANINTMWGQLWINELANQGVNVICLSPGSRSTPLTVAAARHPNLEALIFPDERAAAYFALGYARATGSVAPLVCTSGTAVANYYPALIEASVDNVPMLICSADRPHELYDTGANQTIRQTGLFGDYLRWSFAFPCPTEAIAPQVVQTTAAQAIHRAMSPAGPVHINFSFRKPLEPTNGTISDAYRARVNQQNRPSTRYQTPTTRLSDDTRQDLLATLRQAKRGLVVIGRLPTHQGQNALIPFCEALGWPVLADLGSGLRFSPELHTQIHNAEAMLTASETRSRYQPDTVLHLGGPLMSKYIPLLLSSTPQPTYVHIHETPNRIDPFHQVQQRVVMPVADCCTSLLDDIHPPKTNPYLDTWKADDARQTNAIQAAFSDDEAFVEPHLARLITSHLQPGHRLFVGNSMPVRYLDRYGDWTAQIPPIGMNRGASGIEGLIASAAGFVHGAGQPGVIYLGDLSSIHDLNSLHLLKESQTPLVVVVPNNQGGGIFRLLPIAHHDDMFDTYFHTTHTTSIAKVAEAIGLQAHICTNAKSFVAAYKQAQAQQVPVIIEVPTNSTHDREWTRRLHETQTQTRQEKGPQS